jgi:cell division protein FtsB
MSEASKSYQGKKEAFSYLKDVGEKAKFQASALHKKKPSLETRIAELEAENRELKAEIKRLKKIRPIPDENAFKKEFGWE